MSEPARKKRVKAGKQKLLKPVPDPKRDSEDIERAVYDGMQDLRVKKQR
jgi:hypothetical protein